MKLPPLRLAGANFWPKKNHPSCQILTNLALCALARQAEGPAPGLVELDGGGRVVGPARQGGDHHPRHLQDHRDEGVQVGDGVPAHLLRLIGRPGTVLLACVSQ